MNTFGHTFDKRAWSRRRAKQLRNLKVLEVSSVDRGAAGDEFGRGRARVVLRKRHEEKMQKRPHADFEPFALEEHGLEKARSVLRAMDLGKAFAAHESGKLSNVQLSDILRGLADAEHPGDKRAMLKYIEKNKASFAAHMASNYSQSQHQSALGDGYNVDDAHQHARDHSAVGNGQGFRDPPTAAVGNGPYDTAAASIGSGFANSNSSVENPMQVGKAAMLARVHKQAVADGFDADQVWSALHRIERKEAFGW